MFLTDTCSVGYVKLRHDSPNVLSASHRLYESRGFRTIDAYKGSETTEPIPDLAVFKDLCLQFDFCENIPKLVIDLESRILGLSSGEMDFEKPTLRKETISIWEMMHSGYKH